jgi:dephospho-CoA kinase
MSRPLAVAITGGIGAGKSEALAAFARHGAATISSDEIVHRLLREDEQVRNALLERFGERILDEAGQLDRSAIAEVVFGDREALDWLERLLHPLVAREYLEWREELGHLANPPAVCATEVPLLYEAGGEDRFDAVVVVTAPPEVRAARSRVQAELREPRLLPDDEKVKRADYVYVNDGTLEELDAFVAGVMRDLGARA